jgi:hypothetical protein
MARTTDPRPEPPSPWRLFATARDPAREPELRAVGVLVLARGGDAVPPVAPGDLLVRRALGEGRLAILSAVGGPVARRPALEVRGVWCEGREDGLFVEVFPAPRGARVGRRVAGLDGRVAADTVLLRLHGAAGERVVVPAEPAREAVAPRERLRPAQAAVPVPIPAPRAVGTATEPVRPIRPPLSLGSSVGRGGRNRPADVRAVQDRLVELRELSAADAAAERPDGDEEAVSAASLPRTLAAIEGFQHHVGLPATGAIRDADTRRRLDAAIPLPTAPELAAVAARRAAIQETVTRGLQLTGPVGALDGEGNAPADVRALQGRLVLLGHLAAAHGEAPPADAAARVPPSALRATVKAIEGLQRDVQFWVARRVVSGGVTPGIVRPGDATAALLDRIAVYDLSSGGVHVRVRDHVASRATQDSTGVVFEGSAPPSAVPPADWLALGLTPAQATALRYVSQAEGRGFDAVNTYDVARVSVGLIQFAGGRGLPRLLALWKARSPASFQGWLQAHGIDVEFTVTGGGIDRPQVVVVDPARGLVRGVPAEEAIRADKRLTAVLLLSGRDAEVQRIQIEAAIRDYVRTALEGRVTWAGAGAPLRDVVGSERGLAMVFDRSIHEGPEAGRARFERAARAVHERAAVADAAALRAREAEVLAELEADLRRAARVAALLETCAAGLAASSAAATGEPTVEAALARRDLAAAREALASARTELAPVRYVMPRPGATIDATHAQLDAALRAELARLAFAAPPDTVEEVAEALAASAKAVTVASRRVATARESLGRIARIAASPLGAPRAAPAAAPGPVMARPSDGGPRAEVTS